MTHIKKCFSVTTTHGSTYCETYEPSADVSTSTTPQVILMVHGCGGSVDHYEQSGIPQLLASQGNTVVCFDWYSHGKSSQVPSKEVRHDLDLFFSQLHDVINSPELPVSQSKVFVAHAFSMGCYILLQYCVRYKPFQYNHTETNTSGTQANAAGAPSPDMGEVKQGPYINKIVLQSPWDGHVPYLLRGLIRVPLLLRLFRPSDMSGIKSMRTLKQLLLKLDRNIDYKQSMEQFADAVLSAGASPGSPSDHQTIVNVSSSSSSSDATSAESVEPVVGVSKDFSLQSISSEEGSSFTVACSVLMIAGTRELPFHITARRITKRIRRKLGAQSSSPLGSASTDEEVTAREQEVESKMVHFQFKTCKYAGHMSFAKHAEDSYVKNFFHKEISEFIAQKPPVQGTK